MNREPLNSSNICSAGYHDPSRTLEIEFRSGGVYQYFDVPKSTYEQLMSASSPGGLLQEQIRGAFRYARV